MGVAVGGYYVSMPHTSSPLMLMLHANTLAFLANVMIDGQAIYHTCIVGSGRMEGGVGWGGGKSGSLGPVALTEGVVLAPVQIIPDKLC